MKKGLKIAAGVVAALILLIVVVIATLPLWFDPNRYKDQIAALVENRTGRELTFLGDLDMSFFPWFGIETGAVTLSNAPGFGDTPFARVENAGAKVKLVPLIFSQEVEVSTVTLDGLVLNLAVNEQGTGNWEDLVPAKTAGQPQAPQPSDQDRISQIAPLALAVGGVQITDATIHWTDATTNTRQSITDLNLRTGSLSLTDPIPLTLSFQGQSNQPALNAQVQLTTQLALALSERIYRLQDLKVDVTVQSPQPQAEVAATLTTDVVFNQAARTITVDDLAIEGQAKQAAETLRLNSRWRAGLRSNCRKRIFTWNRSRPTRSSKARSFPMRACPFS